MDVTRRIALGVAALAAAAGAGWWLVRESTPDPMWLAYKQRFYLPEGRIVDTGNAGVSHSEGQGYGMLFAAAHNDRAVFDSLWKWTKANLARPDGLHAWRYVPGATPPVADTNNASDGDLLMAWALLRAGETWGGAYAADGKKLADALKAAVVEEDGKAYLLPGLVGFTADDSRVVNLSYWIFPALRALAKATGDEVWTRTANTGLALVDAAQFGPRRLSPDWLETAGELRPAAKFPPRFGYDAVRVPLNVIWGGAATPARLAAITAAWNSFKDGAPAWIDVTTDEVSPEKQSAGMRAIAQLTTRADRAALKVPAIDATTDYYAASLLMQTALCLRDLRTDAA